MFIARNILFASVTTALAHFFNDMTYLTRAKRKKNHTTGVIFLQG